MGLSKDRGRTLVWHRGRKGPPCCGWGAAEGPAQDSGAGLDLRAVAARVAVGSGLAPGPRAVGAPGAQQAGLAWAPVCAELAAQRLSTQLHRLHEGRAEPGPEGREQGLGAGSGEAEGR